MAVNKPENKPLQNKPVPAKPAPIPAKPAPMPPKPVYKKKEVTPLAPLFVKENYMWMAIGAVIVALGMILMSGGKNQDPNTFDKTLVYSTTRITIAPILIVLGLLVEVYALFKKPKAIA
jgi:hypothetical protein